MEGHGAVTGVSRPTSLGSCRPYTTQLPWKLRMFMVAIHHMKLCRLEKKTEECENPILIWAI